MRVRARLRTAKPLFAIVMCTPFVIKPVAVPPAEIIGVPRAVTMGKRSNNRFFPSFAMFYAEAARWRKCEKPGFYGVFAQAPVLNTFFVMYIFQTPDRAPVTKVRHRNPPTNHPADAPPTKDMMPPAGDAFPAVFLWPFKVVASGHERAYRGGRTVIPPANPCFEGRI